jgi:hypothetical protein
MIEHFLSVNLYISAIKYWFGVYISELHVEGKTSTAYKGKKNTGVTEENITNLHGSGTRVKKINGN